MCMEHMEVLCQDSGGHFPATNCYLYFADSEIKVERG